MICLNLFLLFIFSNSTCLRLLSHFVLFLIHLHRYLKLEHLQEETGLYAIE
jgi:hypothetical protein